MNKKFVNVAAAHHVLQQSPVDNSVIELLVGFSCSAAGNVTAATAAAIASPQPSYG
jgi:hypothetical protein